MRACRGHCSWATLVREEGIIGEGLLPDVTSHQLLANSTDEA
jgi:hypothetical protein